MTYQFVQAYHDLGVARGPRLAMCWHMAEGGGTVRYLSKENPNGVSVHFVIEYSGTIVQMLRLDHMHSSIRTGSIRLTDDAPYQYQGETVVYGRTAAKAALGEWADITHGTLGPNHATIAVEVEGFAADGPNDAQTEAIGRLATYVGLGANLGHRDFASYKSCPGHRFPWPSAGGHGPTEDEMKSAKLTYYQTANAKTGRTVRDQHGDRIHTTPSTPTGYPLLATDPDDYIIRLPADVVGWIRRTDVGSISEPGPWPPLPEPDCPEPDCADAIAADRATATITYPQ